MSLVVSMRIGKERIDEMVNKYLKECDGCGRQYESNYENSAPCIKCGSEKISIINVRDACDMPVSPEPSRGANKKEKIKRTVIEEWKGVKYTKDAIDGSRVSNVEYDLAQLIHRRDGLNEEIKATRYRLNWHKRRLEKGFFE